MKTIKIENIEIGDYEAFYEGFYTEGILGGEYDRVNKWLKLTLTDESTISEKDVRKYLKNPKIKITLKKETLSKEVNRKFGEKAKILTETPSEIVLLVNSEQKSDVVSFITSKKSDFRLNEDE